MFYYSKSIALLLVLFLSSKSILAVEIKDLYKASVPLNSQNESARLIGFERALETVLVKVTGLENRVQSDQLVKLFKPFESYVLSFSYIENPEYAIFVEQQKLSQFAAQNDEKADTEVVVGLERQLEVNEEGSDEDKEEVGHSGLNSSTLTAVSSDEMPESSANRKALEFKIPEEYLLRVEFSRPAVNRILRQSGYRIWGKSRPSIITWLISEDQGLRSVANEYEAELKLTGFVDNAENRGLHLFFPVADLEDQINTDVNLLWGMFEEGLPEATNRYDYDISLIVVLDSVKSSKKNDDQSVMDIDIHDNNQSVNHDAVIAEQNLKNIGDDEEADAPLVSLRWKLVSSGDDLLPLTVENIVSELPIKDALNSMLAETASVLANKYAVSEERSSTGGLKLVVSGVEGFKSFVDVQTYLSELPPVSKVSVNRIYSNKMEFEIELYDGLDKFQQYIELGGRLDEQTTETSLDNIASDQVIHYIWKITN